MGMRDETGPGSYKSEKEGVRGTCPTHTELLKGSRLCGLHSCTALRHASRSTQKSGRALAHHAFRFTRSTLEVASTKAGRGSRRRLRRKHWRGRGRGGRHRQAIVPFIPPVYAVTGRFSSAAITLHPIKTSHPVAGCDLFRDETLFSSFAGSATGRLRPLGLQIGSALRQEARPQWRPTLRRRHPPSGHSLCCDLLTSRRHLKGQLSPNRLLRRVPRGRLR